MEFFNYKDLMNKRKAIQETRVVNDNELFSVIIRKKSFWYFVEKLRRNKKVGHAAGWDKGE
ncbi:MAG: hypothetical protein SVO01_00820 [Thermotogota bacterium]|nr:hypothetical protein [Thermotogota bacterium]